MTIPPLQPGISGTTPSDTTLQVRPPAQNKGKKLQALMPRLFNLIAETSQQSRHVGHTVAPMMMNPLQKMTAPKPHYEQVLNSFTEVIDTSLKKNFSNMKSQQIDSSGFFEKSFDIFTNAVGNRFVTFNNQVYFRSHLPGNQIVLMEGEMKHSFLTHVTITELPDEEKTEFLEQIDKGCETMAASFLDAVVEYALASSILSTIATYNIKLTDLSQEESEGKLKAQGEKKSAQQEMKAKLQKPSDLRKANNYLKNVLGLVDVLKANKKNRETFEKAVEKEMIEKKERRKEEQKLDETHRSVQSREIEKEQLKRETRESSTVNDLIRKFYTKYSGRIK